MSLLPGGVSVARVAVAALLAVAASPLATLGWRAWLGRSVLPGYGGTPTFFRRLEILFAVGGYLLHPGLASVVPALLALFALPYVARGAPGLSPRAGLVATAAVTYLLFALVLRGVRPEPGPYTEELPAAVELSGWLVAGVVFGLVAATATRTAQ